MCGIAGSFGSSRPGPESWLPLLQHRGPDGEGSWTSQSEQAALAHTRLAIIDLTPEAAQPMASGNGSSHLVFNGELYNYRELREQLSAEGIAFHTQSDTEVVLESLNAWEVGALERFAGMFALAFWNETSRSGLLARDPLGIKPLYYRLFASDDNAPPALAFASETRALRKQFPFQLNTESARDHLLWGTPGEPSTIDTATHCLPAGHFLRWNEGEVEVVEYWRAGFGGKAVGSRQQAVVGNRRQAGDRGLPGSADVPVGFFKGQRSGGRCQGTEVRGQRSAIQGTPFEAPSTRHDEPGTTNQARSTRNEARRTRSALLESVERHLVSDVPIGLFLSGGIDSTALLALTREVQGENATIRTFSIGFDDPQFDESSLAQRTADRFGTDHVEWIIGREEGIAEIPGYLEAMDQPTTDGFNTWCISGLARRHDIKVALSGLGGDELFAGYDSFRRVPQFRRFHRWLGPFRAPAGRLLRRFGPEARWRRLGAFLRSEGSWWDAFHAQRGIFSRDEAERILGELLPAEMGEETDRMSVLRDGKLLAANDPRDIVSLMELTGYMRNQLLRDSDVFSMARGLELRVPLVDSRLFEALAVIPADVRLRQGKQLLLEAVPEIPDFIRDQPKRGFRFPFDNWLQDGFGELLPEGDRVAGVPLDTWYRRWAVAVLLARGQESDRQLRRRKRRN